MDSRTSRPERGRPCCGARVSSTLVAIALLGTVMLGDAAAETSRGRTATRLSPLARNSLYVEALGPGGLYSINFERRVSDHVALRVGYTRWSADIFGSVSIFGTTKGLAVLNVKGVPLGISYLSARGKHHAEIGVGAMIYRAEFGPGLLVVPANGVSADARTERRTSSLYHATFGYRFQPAAGGAFFRLAVSPMINDDGGGLVWPALSVGFTFR